MTSEQFTAAASPDLANRTVAYSYYPTQALQTVVYPSYGSTTDPTATYTYDGFGQMASVQDWLNNTTTFAHDADGNLTDTVLPNGDQNSVTVNAGDAITGITLETQGSSHAVLDSFAYTRDANEQVLTEIDSGGMDGAQTYTYDAANRLASVNGAAQSYDPAQDPTTLPVGATGAYDPAGELCWSATTSGTERRAATLDGLVARAAREKIIARHRNAQRLLEPLPLVIPDADDIAFPDHATRHRRDHQKLLSLICASALLHQHQRTVGSIEVEGRSVRYVEASPDDVALGVRLAERVLTRGGDDLAPQTRRLLAAAEGYAAERAEAEDVAPETVAFTRRELRELLSWSEHQVRIGLARLVALEYLVAVPGGTGRQHRYQMADAPASAPRDALRPVREGGPRGGNGTHAGETADPADRIRASGDGRGFVGVGIDPGSPASGERRA